MKKRPADVSSETSDPISIQSHAGRLDQLEGIPEYDIEAELARKRRAQRRAHRARRIAAVIRMKGDFFPSKEDLLTYALRAHDLRRPCSCRVCRWPRTRTDGLDHRAAKQALRRHDQE